VQEFLDSAILEVMDEHPVRKVMELVEWTVALLHRLGGEDALVPPEERHESVAQRFSLRALEGIAVGVSRNMEKIRALRNPDKFVSERIASFWTQDAVATMSGGGLRGSVRLQRTVPFGMSWFDPDSRS
jgi:hypothetical protein